MLLQASQIIGLPVGATDTQEKVGAIADVVVDPDGGQLLGFVVKTGLFGGRRVLSWQDITDFDHAVILIKSPDVVLPPEEVAPIKKVLAGRRRVLGQKVVTESGTRLGRAADLVINVDTGMATKLYVSHLLEERIIPLDKVVEVTKSKIIVKDDVVLGKSPLTETAAV